MFTVRVILAVISLTIASASNASDSSDQLAAAYEKYRVADLDSALQLLEPLLRAGNLDQPTMLRARELAARTLQSRGEDNFRQARIAEALADFDRQVELQPGRAADHWQRGIAYYYAGEYEKGARQFELHQTVNPQDVENAAWHFLCVARTGKQSVETARKSLIPVTADSRVPMAQIHQMFAGTMTPEDVLSVGEKAGGSAEFYADLYVGLYFEALSRNDESLRLLKKAAGNSAGKNNYMRDVARVHVTLRTKAAARPLLVIKGGSLFDPVAGIFEPVQAILIEGTKIVAVGTTQKPVEIPKDARLIDAAEKYILPGLIDAHVHLVHRLNFAQVSGDEVLPLFVANGVTSVRDTGDEIVAETAVADFAASHPDRCPRVFTASYLLDADPPIHHDIGLPVSDPMKVAAIVDDMVARKVTTLKIYAGTKRPVGRKVIEEGHRHGLVVTGHLGAYSAQDAVEDGIDCLEHITSVFDFAISPEISSQPHPRSMVDLSNPQAMGLIALLAKRKVMVDPTLIVFKNMLLLSDLEEVYGHHDNTSVPERLRTYWDRYRRGQDLDPTTLDLRKKEFAKYQELTGILHAAGVPLLVGTDSPEPYCPPGSALHQEMELMVASGLKPAAVLQAATLNNARVLKQADQLGSIVPGKLADLVILKADPTADIRNTRTIVRVIRGGIDCDSATVLKSVPAK